MADIIRLKSDLLQKRAPTYFGEFLERVCSQRTDVSRAFIITEDGASWDDNNKIIEQGIKEVGARGGLSDGDYIFVDRSREVGVIKRRLDIILDACRSAGIDSTRIVYVSQNSLAALPEGAEGPRWAYFHHFAIAMSRAYRGVDMENSEIGVTDKVLCMNSKIRPHRIALALVARDVCGDRLTLSWRGKETLFNKSNADFEFQNRFPSLRHRVGEEIEIFNLPQTFWGAGGSVEAIPLEASLECFLHLVAESDYLDGSDRFTEKTLKAMIVKRPFLAFGPPGMLRSLRRMGFKTFSPFFDESYDSILDPDKRLMALKKSLSEVMSMTVQHVLEGTREVCAHNYRHLCCGIEDTMLESLHSSLDEVVLTEKR